MKHNHKYKIERVGDGSRPEVDILGVMEDHIDAIKYAKGRGAWGSDAHVSKCETVTIQGRIYLLGDEVKDLDS